MTLSWRLTLGFAALLLVLGLGAAWWLDRLTEDMRGALGEAASEVGASLVTVFRDERVLEERLEGGEFDAAGGSEPARWVEQVVEEVVTTPDPSAGHGTNTERQVKVMVNGRELSAEEIAALPQLGSTRLDPARAGPTHRLLPHGDEPLHEVRFEVKREDGDQPTLVLHGISGKPTAIPLPASRIDGAIDGFRRQLGWGLGMLLLLGTAVAALLARRIAAPLARLSQAAERVGHGELGVQTDPAGPPEVRRSIHAFNSMSAELSVMQAERDRLRADRELAELGEIGRGLAHSLRNPLHALGLSLDILAEGSEPARAAKLAEAGREQLQRIDQTLRGFLALSASAGARVEDVDIAGLLDDVILEARQRAQGRVRIEREACALRLPAVAAELRIVLHALVINAVEASPDDGLVRIECAPCEPEGVVLRVVDEGEGIADAVRDRLFQPHVSSKPAGAGMGLYLAERLVRLRYRGGIALSARGGRGTLAEVRVLPRETQHDA